MSKIKELEQYTTSMLAVVEFRKKHAKVFEELDSLQLASSEAESTLKNKVKEDIKMNISNDHFKVSYAPAFRKGYNTEVILEKITPAMKKELEKSGTMTYSIDKVKFEELVEQGKIPVEIKQAAFEEEELAPRASIKEVKQNEKE